MVREQVGLRASYINMTAEEDADIRAAHAISRLTSISSFGHSTQTGRSCACVQNYHPVYC